jgi:hypothetical protein
MKIRMISYLIIFAAAINIFLSCKRTSNNTAPPPPPPGPDTTIVIQPAVDPPIATTVGFFLDDWQAKNFTAPSYIDTAIPSSANYTVTVDRSSVITKIPRSIFGNNANIWMTQMVTEAPLLDHISKIHPHIIRFPGGSISDIYFWNAPDATPPADATRIISTSKWQQRSCRVLVWKK